MGEVGNYLGILRRITILAWVGTAVAFAIANQWLPAGLLVAAYFISKPVPESEVHMRLYYCWKAVAPPILFVAALIYAVWARFWWGTGLVILTASLLVANAKAHELLTRSSPPWDA